MDVLIIVCTNTSFTLILAFEAAKSTSPLARQCQKSLNDISTRHSVGPWTFRVREDEIADGFTIEGTGHLFFGFEPALGSLGSIQ